MDWKKANKLKLNSDKILLLGELLDWIKRYLPGLSGPILPLNNWVHSLVDTNPCLSMEVQISCDLFWFMIHQG